MGKERFLKPLLTAHVISAIWVGICYAGALIPNELPAWIIEDYKKRNSLPSNWKESIPKEDISYESQDINGDNIPDWFVHYAVYSCGSQGCAGDIYLGIKDGNYCYVGFGHEDILKKVHRKLKCGGKPRLIE